MSNFAVLDIETRSRADLREVGAWRYAVDESSTDTWCAAYAIDAEPVRLWKRGDPVPPAIIKAAADPDTLWVAHNAPFERVIWQHILTPKHSWPKLPPLPRWHCTMVGCLALALPPALKDVADVLALAHRKGDDRIMHIMAKPRAARVGEDPKDIYWFDDSERRETLYAYCCGDVECERDLWRWLSC
jgi:DNA polymerase